MNAETCNSFVSKTTQNAKQKILRLVFWKFWKFWKCGKMAAGQAFQSFCIVVFHLIPEKQGQIVYKTRGLTSSLVRGTRHDKWIEVLINERNHGSPTPLSTTQNRELFVATRRFWTITPQHSQDSYTYITLYVFRNASGLSQYSYKKVWP